MIKDILKVWAECAFYCFCILAFIWVVVTLSAIDFNILDRIQNIIK